MLNVLLLGGTGAIGIYLQQRLAVGGDTVYVTSRREVQDSAIARFYRGDAHDLNFFKHVVDAIKPDCIVDFMLYGTAEFSRKVQCLLQSSAHYIFLSSYRVFADEVPITEKSPRWLDVSHDVEWLHTDDYALAKARQEDILRNSRKDNWTIVRPSITYSRQRFQFGCLEASTVCARSMQGLPVVMPSEMLDKVTTLTWAGDTAEMICRLIHNRDSFAQDYNLSTTESLTWRDVAEIYRQAIGMRVHECSMDFYLKLVDKYQVKYDRMLDRRVDNSKILKTIGLRRDELMSVERGLKLELEAFSRYPQFKTLAIEQNALMDSLLETSISLKGVPWNKRKVYYALRYPWLLNISPRHVVKAFGKIVRRV